jgi:hypothetical protein
VFGVLLPPAFKLRVMDQEQKLEFGRQIWQLCRAGYNRIQILEELAISVQQLEDALREFESQVAFDAGRAMEHYRCLDNERIEEVIQCWMGVALDDPPSPDEALYDDDFDLRLRASYGALAAIGARQKILLASQPEKTSVRERNIDVLGWLQQLHCAGTNINSNDSNNSNGSIR